eukprot:snap_masked-scaffold_78-processed-gene-0.46-mRNA-1 protein AED:1.00 eAED:1.00 QI:0/0/0/0/1/1/3/0/59
MFIGPLLSYFCSSWLSTRNLFRYEYLFCLCYNQVKAIFVSYLEGALTILFICAQSCECI